MTPEGDTSVLSIVRTWLTSQYKELTQEMEAFDQRLLHAEKKLNDLDVRLKRSEDRAGITHRSEERCD